MPPRIRTFGAAPITASVFNDSFSVGNNEPLLLASPSWTALGCAPLFASTGNSNPGTFPRVTQACAEVAGGVLVLTVGGAGGVTTQIRTWFTPMKVWGPLLDGLKQFSQCVIVADTSGGGAVNRWGLGVFCQQWDPVFNGIGGGYYLEIRGDTLAMVLYRGLGSGGSGTGTTLLTTAGSFAFGDTIRLECIPGAGSNVVNVLKNAVQVATFTDSDGTRPLTGFPGFGYTFQNDNAAFTTIDDYSGGPF